MKKGKRGEITIFVTLIMMCMFSLICVIVESARTAGARWYVQMAANSALDSVFSQYHRQLWDDYRILLAEYEDTDELVEEYAGFLQPYINVPNWYPLEYISSAAVVERVTQEDGIYFEKEILDYMKYGVWNLDFSPEEAQSLWDSAREAAAVKTVGETYRGHAREVLKLEKSLEAISQNIERQKEKKEQGIGRLGRYDGSGFRKVAKELIQDLEKMPGLVDSYERQADLLAAKLQGSREEYNQRAEELGDLVKQMLEKEIQEYESYVDADGKRRQEILNLRELSRHQKEQVQEVIEEALKVEDIIDSWASDDEEEEGPDLDALWNPVKRRFAALPVTPLSFAHGVKDKEKEGWLKNVESMYQSGILSLVLPEGQEASQKEANLTAAPSKEELLLTGARGIGLGEHLLMDEYCGIFFSNFCSQKESLKEGPEKRVLEYEVEYLLTGKNTDQENLTGVVTSLLALREGLNMIHILSDGEKREQARTLAMTITGAAALTPLLMVTTFFVMAVWALGEAVMDVRGLLAGKKVLLVKGKGDWTLSTEQLLTMGKSKKADTGGGENGLSYLSWLKILLFMCNIMEQEYRMMDVMQMNLRLRQGNFRMNNGVYQVNITSQLRGKRVFFSLGFVDRYLGGGNYQYPMEVKAERVY